MPLFVGSTVINVSDLERAVRFWSAALGYVVREASENFVVLTDPRRRWSNVSLQAWDVPKPPVNRLHFDLYSQDPEADVQRLLQLGAVRIPWDYLPDPDYVVLADPDGNEFCVVDSHDTQE